MPMPKPLTIPFARDALSQFINEIPDTPQAGANPQLASWSEGFGPITMQPLTSGGKPPEGPDFNGILSALSEHIVYQNGGGIYTFSQEYVDKTGGYDKGSVLIGDDGSALWVSLSDNNTENFNTATPPTEWIKISSAGVEQQIQDILTMIGTKADKTIQVIAGTGLSGGGNLQANRTLSVNYGATEGTAAQGNDSRITGAAQKSANLSDLSSAPAARQNLGLGTAATRDVGTGGGDVMEGGMFGLGSYSDLSPATPRMLSEFGGGLSLAADHDEKSIPSGIGLFNCYYNLMHLVGGPSSANNTQMQLFCSNNPANRLFFRSSRRGEFSSSRDSWQEIHHTGNILATTGQSTQYPMTQKAVTDAINSSAIGVGQTWQDVTGSRVAGTTYTNNTGKPIMVSVRSDVDDGYSQLTVGGIVVAVSGNTFGAGNNRHTVCAIVPNGVSYSYGGSAIALWAELR